MDGKITISEKCLSREEILDYKSGNLGEQGLRRVEEHLIDCPLCSDAVDALDEYKTEEIKSGINKVSKKVGASVKSNYNIRMMVTSAAAVLMIVSVSLLYLMNSSMNEKLYTEYFDIYPDVTMHKRSGGDVNKLNEAMDLYNQGKYPESIAAFNKILETGRNESAYFYKGVSLMALDKFAEAILTFENITTDAGNGFYSEANWYTALCYIFLDDIKSAKRYLFITAESPDYKIQSKEIMERLEN
ncbi:MAG: tetratricopeptide repeat protein [Melioribacteraceae bacterium]|nr:tetratricopeptide repeat protein [Melioribacteraceae bacterium]MCF8355234.1 tetratricopeptide repeat protein [Melioribacteraceae bacterium]MCF8395221.1 tetratricopeptide repeat protein [Melioribacteraceae bacterium]MCF8420695.1 tetratricopeptide repeat protein [Melioribacteraceae bacterium]